MWKQEDLARTEEKESEEIENSCNACENEATRKNNLGAHVKAAHEENKIDCDQCGNEATRKNNLGAHVKADQEENKIDCDQCGNKATRSCNLKGHVQSVHEKVKFNCDQCGQKATWESNHKAHVQSVHEGLDSQHPIPVPVRAVLEVKVGGAACLRNQAWDPGRDARVTAADAKIPNKDKGKHNAISKEEENNVIPEESAAKEFKAAAKKFRKVAGVRDADAAMSSARGIKNQGSGRLKTKTIVIAVDFRVGIAT